MPPVVVFKKRKIGVQKKPLFILVGKASIKSAAKRNLVRRRIKAIMRPFLLERKNDFYIIVKKGANVVSFENLEKEITQAAKKE